MSKRVQRVFVKKRHYYSVCVDGMVASALMVPLLGSIAAEFPDASPELLNQTLSLPALLMIPSI
jgi:hypothetical protein